ncbi:conserved hypothetical protein [Hyella patelloides LEGE 07179]|uniref:Uncharacterized protein n=1 Tax=Hyella patelloides LEGE 07179 TaxID=945734 RepID=A0A563VJ48_9CYAN|nr:hypothetical protein [Hyella patelloides]VEP11413.1 conserved hypothetical protein [Hyella patelloides LEGE 07179]
MNPIKTLKIGQISLDFDRDVYDRLISNYGELTEFIDRLKSFMTKVASHKDEYNINPYTDKIKRGIYILGKDDSELGIFPDSHLVLKCSQSKPLAENLRKQFYRSIQLAQNFEEQLNSDQKALLQICPVYLYVQINSPSFFFKQNLFMQRVEGDTTLGNTKSGFSGEFCEVFQIPSLEKIRTLSQFALHRYLDRDKQRQLFKIQTAYLFQRLWLKGMKIFSLNQKNILVSQDPNNGQTRYLIIDPIADYLLPISPAYNSLTLPLIG